MEHFILFIFIYKGVLVIYQYLYFSKSIEQIKISNKMLGFNDVNLKLCICYDLYSFLVGFYFIFKRIYISFSKLNEDVIYSKLNCFRFFLHLMTYGYFYYLTIIMLTRHVMGSSL